MTHPAHHDPRPFLSVIRWPDGATRNSMAELLAEVSGIDVLTLRLRLGQAPPSIIGQVEPEAAERSIRAIGEHRGDAFSVTLADLASLGPARRVRAMSISSGVLAMKLWDGEAAALRFQDLWLLVQGMIRERKRDQGSGLAGSRGDGGTTANALGANGLARYFAEGYLSSASSPAESAAMTQARSKLHIHDAHGAIYEVEGRRFDVSVLGEMKQHNDRANMEQLCELLSHLAPDEIVDPFFPLWKPPPGHHKLRIKGEVARGDRPFAFYSRWVARMYRYLLQRSDDEMFTEE